jgi:hypothetical protein
LAVLEELAGALEAPPAALVLVVLRVATLEMLDEGVTTGARVDAEVVALEPKQTVQTVLVRTSVLTLVVFPDVAVMDEETAVVVFVDEAVTLALADEDPDAEDEEVPPVMWNGKEYWKVAGLASRTILKP